MKSHYGSLPTSGIQCGDHIGYDDGNTIYGAESKMVFTMVPDRP